MSTLLKAGDKVWVTTRAGDETELWPHVCRARRAAREASRSVASLVCLAPYPHQPDSLRLTGIHTAQDATQHELRRSYLGPRVSHRPAEGDFQ